MKTNSKSESLQKIRKGVKRVSELPIEKQFHFRDGTSAKNLRDLKEKIESLPYNEFYNHVNAEKNDFANWVENVLEQHDLSERMRKVGSIVETVEFLNKALYPEEVEQDEIELKKEEMPDFQERIEDEFFSEPSSAEVKEEIPEVSVESDGLNKKEEESNDGKSVVSSQEEVTARRVPGAPVTTNEPAHVPITKKIEPVEPEKSFIVKQFIYGFIFGIIIGLILGRIVSMF